jgi:hypothetical protein
MLWVQKVLSDWSADMHRQVARCFTSPGAHYAVMQDDCTVCLGELAYGSAGQQQLCCRPVGSGTVCSQCKLLWMKWQLPAGGL